MLTSSGIFVESYVQGSDGTLIPFEELTPEQKRRAATELKARWLNELFAGRATVFPEEEEKTNDKAAQPWGTPRPPGGDTGALTHDRRDERPAL